MIVRHAAGLAALGLVLGVLSLGLSKAQAPPREATGVDAPLPPDVDPVSRNRLPLPTRADMANDEERKIFDEEVKRGPATRLFSPIVGKALDDAHTYVKFHTAMDSRLVQIASLVTARASIPACRTS